MRNFLKNKYTQFIACVAGLFLFYVFIKPSFAAVNEQIPYQGRLANSSGVSVTDGSYDIVFNIYTVSSGGTAIWTESHTTANGNPVTVDDGIFSVMLGSDTSFSSINFNQTLYLGITVESDAEMTPRKIIGSVPQALVSKYLETSSGSGASAGTSANNVLLLDSEGDINLIDNALIYSDGIYARDSGGLVLYEDGGSGLFVKDGGNVGVGSTNPLALIHVGSSGTPSSIDGVDDLYIYDDLEVDGGIYTEGLTVDGNVFMGDSTANTSILRIENIDRQWEWYANADYDFFGLYDRTGGAYRMAVDYDGKIGIGTTDPDAKLQILNIDANGSSNAGDSTLTLGQSTSGSINLRFFIDDTNDYVHIESQEYGITNVVDLGLNENGGNVIIGKSSSGGKLGVLLSDPSQTVEISDGDDTQGTLSLRRIDTNSAIGADVLIGKVQFTSNSGTETPAEFASIRSYTDNAATVTDDYPSRVSVWTTADSSGTPTERMRIDSTGLTTTYGGIDVSYGGVSLLIGADNNNTSRTNSTIKYGRMGSYHYTNTEEPIAGLFFGANETSNVLSIGGGTSLMNAATEVRIYTASDTTTTTGTRVAYFNPDGVYTDTVDFYPNEAGTGLMARVSDYLGIGDVTEHFRDSTIPTGYSWAGSPFETPTVITYRGDDYLRISNSSGGRSFLYQSIGSDGTNWQGKRFYTRSRSGSNRLTGIRFDDGTDDNYVELVIDGSASDATQSLTYNYRTGGGTVSTVTTNVNVPVSEYLTVMLYCYYSGGNYYAYGYLISEDAQTTNISGFNQQLTWLPTAGRVGLLFDTDGTSNPGYVDWFKDEF